MKTYFAKYLPAEGKITDATKVMFKINDEWTEPCDFDSFIGPDIQKVAQGKLFICSRDMKIGGGIYVPDSPLTDMHKGNIGVVSDINVANQVVHYTIDCLIGGVIHSGIFMKENPFKIIGMVFSEDTWVKEGDEFDKEDLEANGCGPNWNDIPTDIWKFKIKCPTCKLYH